MSAWTGTPPLPVEITNHTSLWETLVPPLLAALLAAAATLGAVAITQWGQRRNDHNSAIRNQRIEQIANFLDAAHAVQRVLQERAQNPVHGAMVQQISSAGSPVHQLWLREKAIFIVCTEPVRQAAKKYAQKLTEAEKKGTGGKDPQKYCEAEEWKFLQAARLEMDK